MRRLSNQEIMMLAHSSSYEEFLVNKDLLGLKKPLCQKMSFDVLAALAAQQHDASLACKLVREGKHVTIGDTLRHKMMLHVDDVEFLHNYISKNCCLILNELLLWFCLS